MEIESYLTDVYGPRLTGSPNIKEAADWAQKTMKEWGLANVKTEDVAVRPRLAESALRRQRRHAARLSADRVPESVDARHQRPVTGEAVMAVITSDKDFDTYRGKLRGKYVLSVAMREVTPQFEPPGHRYNDAELADLAKQPAGGGRGGRGRGNFDQAFTARRNQFWLDEGVAAVLDFSRNGDGGTLFVQGGGPRDAKQPPVPAQVTLAVEHYGRIWRTLAKKIPVTLTMDIDNKFFDSDLNAFNIVGELPGTDKADELVMLGAHFDSWHTGTGATDNAAGSAVMMEAMRILKSTGVQLRPDGAHRPLGRRGAGTARSKEYVKAHFGDPATMQLKPDHAKFCGYFNVDNGTGVIRGVYCRATKRRADLSGVDGTVPQHGDDDADDPQHRRHGPSVVRRGRLAGFQFIQDEVEYDSRTHHSNMDMYERVQATDMMRNAVIVAAFVYNTANRDEKLPRKPLPKPAAPTEAARRSSRDRSQARHAEIAEQTSLCVFCAVLLLNVRASRPGTEPIRGSSRASGTSSSSSANHGSRNVQLLSATLAGTLMRSRQPKTS
jgi:hypothetical protein